jgi:hypothetical protein
MPNLWTGEVESYRHYLHAVVSFSFDAKTSRASSFLFLAE